jgi:hypothetical protein
MFDIAVTAAITQLTVPDYAVTVSPSVTLSLAYFTETDRKCTIPHGQ